jgi:hypothetical protein
MWRKKRIEEGRVKERRWIVCKIDIVVKSLSAQRIVPVCIGADKMPKVVLPRMQYYHLWYLP